MKIYRLIALTLVIIGGLNLGLTGLFELDLIDALIKSPIIPRIINVLIGFSALYLIITPKRVVEKTPNEEGEEPKTRTTKK